jgi:PAS domain S-box-containing protein
LNDALQQRLLRLAEAHHTTPTDMLTDILNILEREDWQGIERDRERFRSLVETQSAYIVRTDLNGVYTYVNQRFAQDFHWLAEDGEFIGKNSMDSIAQEDHEATLEICRRCIAQPNTSLQIVLRKPYHRQYGTRWTLWEFVAIEHAGRVKEMQCVGFDITEIKRAEQTLMASERLKARLKKERELNSLIQRAVASLAHDVRTPLAVISTARDMLDTYFDRISEEKRKEKLQSIEKQLRYVTSLLNDFNSAIQSQFTRHPFHPTPLDIVALCHAIVKEVETVSDQPPRFEILNPHGLGIVTVDETLVSRILLNLLSNAVKFSPADSTISLKVDLSQHDGGLWLALYVRDEGMGISPDDQQRIFEPFYRAKSAENIKGTGLGLSIVQDCVMQHHGSITLESAVGKGTTFTVYLPIPESDVTTM